MTDIKWGDPIPVDGKRPDWLRGDEIVRYDMLIGPARSLSWTGVLNEYRLLADHPYYTVQRHNAQNGTNFTYWPGGENAPDDWDGGDCLRACGGSVIKATSWKRLEDRTDIIGYTPRAEGLPATDGPAQWAYDRALVLIGAKPITDSLGVFARYIEQHEQPPVDPDVLAVREILAQYTLHFDESYTTDEMYVKGRCDDTTWFQSALAAYRKHRQ